MKRHIVAALITSALVVAGSMSKSAVKAGQPRIQSAVMQFDEPARLGDVILKGEYLFLHHRA